MIGRRHSSRHLIIHGSQTLMTYSTYIHVQVHYTVGHEELWNKVNVPVTATSHLLWRLVFTAKVLVELYIRILASGDPPKQCVSAMRFMKVTWNLGSSSQNQHYMYIHIPTCMFSMRQRAVPRRARSHLPPIQRPFNPRSSPVRSLVDSGFKSAFSFVFPFSRPFKHVPVH